MWLCVEKLFQCRRNHRIKHVVVRKIMSPRNRSRCHKFVNWFSNLNFFDPEHGDLRFGCTHTNFSSEVDFPALKFHRVTDVIPKSEISGDQSYHRENKFHQYDSTYHFNIRSDVIETTYSTILFSFHSLSLFAVSVVSCLNSWEVDAEFFELLKIVEDSPSWADGRAKTFPIIPVQFCVLRGNSESQRCKVLGLRIVELRSGTWVAPELLPDWIVKIPSHLTWNLFCSVTPEFEPMIDPLS